MKVLRLVVAFGLAGLPVGETFGRRWVEDGFVGLPLLMVSCIVS